jgi:FkbM family methyltransferase
MKKLPRHTCTSAETAKQTTRLQKRFQEWWSHSACPDQVWMEHIDVLFDEVTKFDSSFHSRPQQQQKQQQQPFLILDIGCNKGYTSADFFDTLSPGTNMNPKTLVGAIRSIASEDNIKIDRDGGVCNDSNKALNKDRDTVRDVEVHCFEPSPATFEMLNRAHVKLMPKNNEEKQSSSAVGNNNVVNGMTVSGTNWYIHNKGLHNTNGKMMWHKACGTAIGDELCTIVDEGTEDAIVVPVVTVDKFMEETFTVAAAGGDEQQLPLVHMLKIDAEGLDPAVLQGSTNLLTANRAIMVMFEFNPGLSEKGDTPHGMWGKRGNPHVTLLDVTNWLDTLGYDCYLDTHLPDEREMKKGVLDAPALYRITGDCLNREPSVRGWANVVCAARKYGSVAERLLKLATIVKP